VDVVKLQARMRPGIGKSQTRKIRAQGWIPAVYYGHNQETKSIEINARDFAGLVRARKTNNLIDLCLQGQEGDSIAIVKEMQRHVIRTEYFYHLDFQHVNMNEKITVKCHVEVVGIPVGVTEDGGVLGHSVQYLSIECLPTDIPEKITVDVSALKVGQSIHVRDISVPNSVIKDSPEVVIAVVTHASKEVEAVLPAEGEAAEGEAVAAAAGTEKDKAEKTDKPEKSEKSDKKSDK
jgi:large subunit ribosomal protein L25